MKTVLIVDDNVQGGERLTQIARNLGPGIAALYAADADKAYLLAVENEIDLFVVDIILSLHRKDDISGIVFAEKIRDLGQYKYTPIIFLTSLESMKLYAYSNIHCFQYIVKPYKEEEVSKAMVEALGVPTLKNSSQNAFFRKDGVLYKKDFTDIVYIENFRTGRVIHSVNGNLELGYKTCRETLDELNSDRFLQCSRTVIVNRDYIDCIDTSKRSIKLRNHSEQVEIGVAFKKKFLRDFFNG